MPVPPISTKTFLQTQITTVADVGRPDSIHSDFGALQITNLLTYSCPITVIMTKHSISVTFHCNEREWHLWDESWMAIDNMARSCHVQSGHITCIQCHGHLLTAIDADRMQCTCHIMSSLRLLFPLRRLVSHTATVISSSSNRYR